MKSLRIGSLDIASPLMLAPMAGITDPPFRTLVESFGGAGLMFSEMIPCRSLVPSRIHELEAKVRTVSPVNAVQLVGNDPYHMSEAAKINVDLCSADIIDINFGCPVKKVVKGFAGSALMRDLKLAGAIVEAVARAVEVPVTLKMRLGWDFDSLNAPVLAKIAEEAGAQMVTVHARTRNQFYGGRANWKLVSEVRGSVKIPVIVNGDIRTVQHLGQALEESQADGAMVARGACGRPWLFRQLTEEMDGRDYTAISPEKLRETVLWHLDLMVQHYGEKRAGPLCRKHLNFYSAGLAGSSEFRGLINGLETMDRIGAETDRFFSSLAESATAGTSGLESALIL
ncbi:MAG: tRNA dihydrouridine synthase DusB [Rickettsiales bacterium]|jgi:tRNA-dihydrouridine synthase B|nr:tRNA dihydrouridine synthase DusB [Rickettsiales bacterium]